MRLLQRLKRGDCRPQMTGKSKSITMKDLRCSVCGQVFRIPRKSGRNKVAGHKKKLYCFVCKKRTVHREMTTEGVKLKGRK